MKNEFSYTAFEKDSNCEFAELFLQIRDYIKICIGNEVKEKHNSNTTSFYSKEGGICSLRVKNDYISLLWFKGAFIEDKYNQLKGKGKVSRVQKVYCLDKQTREAIRYYYKESFIKQVEYNELKKIKSNL